MSEEITEANKTDFDKATRVLVEEIRKYGFSTDTMASDRLHAFETALGLVGQVKAANRIANLDKFACHGRRDAEIYALLVIGSLYAEKGELIDLFRNEATQA